MTHRGTQILAFLFARHNFPFREDDHDAREVFSENLYKDLLAHKDDWSGGAFNFVQGKFTSLLYNMTPRITVSDLFRQTLRTVGGDHGVLSEKGIEKFHEWFLSDDFEKDMREYSEKEYEWMTEEYRDRAGLKKMIESGFVAPPPPSVKLKLSFMLKNEQKFHFSWIPPRPGFSETIGFFVTSATKFFTTQGKKLDDKVISFPEGTFKRVLFSLNGNMFARVVDDAVEVYRTKRQGENQPVERINATVKNVAFNPRDPEIIAYSTEDGLFMGRSYPSGPWSHSAIVERNDIVSFGFSPAGDRLAFVTGEGDVQIRNVTRIFPKPKIRRIEASL